MKRSVAHLTGIFGFALFAASAGTFAVDACPAAMWPDGRVVVCHFVAWVGSYESIRTGRSSPGDRFSLELRT